MHAALGLKAHSGWAALVAIGAEGGALRLIERRRIELAEEDAQWARQPYHAAEHLTPEQAAATVRRGIEAARRMARRQLQAAAERLRESGHEPAACAVLIPQPMPDWSTAQILAVHIRMHKAEGVLFPAALCSGAEACDLKLLALPEKQLAEIASRNLGANLGRVSGVLAALGKSAGAPWGSDQKTAALAAALALRGA